MSRYSNQIVDQYGAPIEGVSIYVYDQAEALATLEEDGGGDLDNPVTSDEYGNFHFNTDDGVYSLHYRYAGKLIQVDEAVMVGVGIPLPDSVLLALALDTGAAIVGTDSGASVQAELDARPLSTDLSADGGAALIGTTLGGSVFTILERGLTAVYDQAMTWPSGADINCAGYVPNSAANARSIMARLPRDRFLIRTLRTSGVIEEFILRNVGAHGGVGGGLLIIGHTAYYDGQVYRWLAQPEDLDYCTNSQWALRMGQDAALDGSNNTAINANVVGLLHGNMTVVSDPVLQASGAGSNLYLIANLAEGAAVSAATITLQQNFEGQLPGGSTLAATMSDFHTYSADFGMVNELWIEAEVVNLVIQDSPVGMMACTIGELGADRIKLAGGAVFTPDGGGCHCLQRRRPERDDNDLSGLCPGEAGSDAYRPADHPEQQCRESPRNPERGPQFRGMVEERQHPLRPHQRAAILQDQPLRPVHCRHAAADRVAHSDGRYPQMPLAAIHRSRSPRMISRRKHATPIAPETRR